MKVCDAFHNPLVIEKVVHLPHAGALALGGEGQNHRGPRPTVGASPDSRLYIRGRPQTIRPYGSRAVVPVGLGILTVDASHAGRQAVPTGATGASLRGMNPTQLTHKCHRSAYEECFILTLRSSEVCGHGRKPHASHVSPSEVTSEAGPLT